MYKDINYNVKVEFDNGDEAYMYAQRLSNENLDHWKDWQCASGVHSIYIYESEIYGGECRNDRLGTFGDWDLLPKFTTCKQETCSGCLTDLLQEKYQ